MPRRPEHLGWWMMGLGRAQGKACPPGLAGAEELTVQPLQGQSPEQVRQDMAACQNSATQATGYSPSQEPVAAALSGSSGKRLKGAAAGAVAGSVRAEACGNDSAAWDEVDDDRKQDYRQDEAQSSAKASAVVGGMSTRSEGRQGQQQHHATAWT